MGSELTLPNLMQYSDLILGPIKVNHDAPAIRDVLEWDPRQKTELEPKPNWGNKTLREVSGQKGSGVGPEMRRP